MANPVRIQCTVSSIIHHDEVVSTVTLKPSRRLPNFKPGQFMHLALDPYDPTIGFWPESRVFSIASTPSDSELTIAYAVKGAFTKRMKAELTDLLPRRSGRNDQRLQSRPDGQGRQARKHPNRRMGIDKMTEAEIRQQIASLVTQFHQTRSAKQTYIPGKSPVRLSKEI